MALQAHVDLCNDAVVIASLQGVIVATNQAADTLLNQKRCSLTGESLPCIMDSRYTSLVKQLLDRASGDDSPIAGRLNVCSAAGRMIDIQLTLQVQLIQSERFICATMQPVCQDSIPAHVQVPSTVSGAPNTAVSDRSLSVRNCIPSTITSSPIGVVMNTAKQLAQLALEQHAPSRDKPLHVSASTPTCSQHVAAARESDHMHVLKCSLQALLDPVLVADVNCNILLLNPAAERLFGYSASELIGRNVSMLCEPAIAAVHHTFITNYLSTGQPKIIGKRYREVRGQHKTGHLIDLLLSVSDYRDPASGRRYFIGCLHDQTELKKLQAAEQQALQVAQAKALFLANMSHEIRTPLNAVVGCTEVLVSSPEFAALTEDQQQCIETIHASGGYLLQLTNDVLDFSKIEANRMQLEQLPFSVLKCIKKVTRIFSQTAAKKGVPLTFLLADHTPECVIGDEKRIAQVITNLVSNALKFSDTPAGRTQGIIITCSTTTASTALTETKSPAALPVAATAALNAPANASTSDRVWLEFSVRDHGIGIAPDRAVNLFNDYVQADISHARRYGGTGLGLSICRKIAELFGGRITVDSQVGVGSVFRLTCPFMIAEPSSVTITPPLTSAAMPVTHQQHQSELPAAAQAVSSSLLSPVLSTTSPCSSRDGSDNCTAKITITSPQRLSICDRRPASDQDLHVNDAAGAMATQSGHVASTGMARSHSKFRLPALRGRSWTPPPPCRRSLFHAATGVVDSSAIKQSLPGRADKTRNSNGSQREDMDEAGSDRDQCTAMEREQGMRFKSGSQSVKLHERGRNFLALHEERAARAHAAAPRLLSVFTDPLALPHTGSAASVPNSPLSSASEPASPLPFELSNEQWQQIKVLIVDDYEGNRKLFKRFLHGLPCSIDLAEDGNEAVRKAACVDYDIIFTDVHMPGRDGIEMTRLIRALYSRRLEPSSAHASKPLLGIAENSFSRTHSMLRPFIIGVTADTSSTTLSACYDAGMQEIIVKPCVMKNVRERATRLAFRALHVREILNQQHASKQACDRTKTWPQSVASSCSGSAPSSPILPDMSVSSSHAKMDIKLQEACAVQCDQKAVSSPSIARSFVIGQSLRSHAPSATATPSSTGHSSPLMHAGFNSDSCHSDVFKLLCES